MAFRLSKIFKALDKHELTTPQTIKELLGAGEEAGITDPATGRGYVHKIVELFEPPHEDEFLESQIIPSLTLLVTAGADINLRDTDGNTPLHLAFILNSGPRIVNMLIKLGADLTILNDSKQKVGDLIGRSTDPRMVKALGLMMPGLWHAVESCDQEKAKEMLEKWCKIDVVIDGKSLVERAKEVGDQQIITILQNHWPTNQFIYAAYAQDTKKMKKILRKEKININVKDVSMLDDDGDEVQMTLLGECLLLNLFDSAKFLVEKGANLNEKIVFGKTEEPLFFYLMKYNPSLMFSTVFANLLDKAELKLIKKFSVGVLYTGFTHSWPDEVVRKLLSKGMEITQRSEEGYSLRDNILVQVAFYPRKKRLKKLYYVDQHIIELATTGNLERLKVLAQNGYMTLNVSDKKGRSSAYLAQKEGQKEVAEWLENVGEQFKKVFSLFESIKQGNLAKAREYLDPQTAFCKDRAGRSALHIAVLYERRFVVKYLLKEFPATVRIKDDVGRTALHYACTLPDAQDIEDLLSQNGADETSQDELKRCPMDYKLNDDENFGEVERKKTCAFNIYLLEVYLNFADGIIEDDFDLVRDTRDDLYENVKMDDIIKNMYKNVKEDPPGFLQMCLDHRRENIARYLINNGVDMWEDVQFENQVLKFPLAAEKAKMTRLMEFIAKKRREDETMEKKFQEAELVIKTAHGFAGESPRSDHNDEHTDSEKEEKSKSCTIL